MTTHQNNSNDEKRVRKSPVRSQYLFPAYDFRTALTIADRIAKVGGGSLSEETLAMELESSAKSSGFRVKGLTARQFGLVTKTGNNLITTHIAQAILKPTNEQEKSDAMRTSFLTIPLFRAVASRFKGQPLPQGEQFRNLLEREFKIDSRRVKDAERVLIDSARDTGVLRRSGTSIYLVTEGTPAGQETTMDQRVFIESQGISTQPQPSATVQPIVAPAGGLPTISEQDLAELSNEDFNKLWEVLGKIIRARSRQGYDEENRVADDRSKMQTDVEANEDNYT